MNTELNKLNQDFCLLKCNLFIEYIKQSFKLNIKKFLLDFKNIWENVSSSDKNITEINIQLFNEFKKDYTNLYKKYISNQMNTMENINYIDDQIYSILIFHVKVMKYLCLISEINKNIFFINSYSF
jgi:hypothetical protein